MLYITGVSRRYRVKTVSKTWSLSEDHVDITLEFGLCRCFVAVVPRKHLSRFSGKYFLVLVMVYESKIRG